MIVLIVLWILFERLHWDLTVLVVGMEIACVIGIVCGILSNRGESNE